MQGWIQPGWTSIKAPSRTIDRSFIAIAVMILVHSVGLVGMFFVDRQLFIAATPLNLVLIQVLAWWTFRGEGRTYLRAFLILALAGLLAEWGGVHTGLLFGDYSYGDLLGPKVAEVPVLIGGNWFIVLSGSLACAYFLQVRLSRWLVLPIPFAAAAIATLFDVVMEPTAMKLGFWNWEGSDVPVYNYICWFVVSYLVIWMAGERLRPVATTFVARVLLVQALFFLLAGFLR